MPAALSTSRLPPQDRVELAQTPSGQKLEAAQVRAQQQNQFWPEEEPAARWPIAAAIAHSYTLVLPPFPTRKEEVSLWWKMEAVKRERYTAIGVRDAAVCGRDACNAGHSPCNMGKKACRDRMVAQAVIWRGDAGRGGECDTRGGRGGGGSSAASDALRREQAAHARVVGALQERMVVVKKAKVKEREACHSELRAMVDAKVAAVITESLAEVANALQYNTM